jgi:hypothetical protein
LIPGLTGRISGGKSNGSVLIPPSHGRRAQHHTEPITALGKRKSP